MDQPQVLGTIPWSTRGSTKEGGRKRTKEQSTQALAGCPARRGGLSARATRTIRQCTADCPHRYGWPSSLGRGLSVKANRTTRTDPRKTDRPRRPGGPSARVPDRPLLKLGPSANRLQQKPNTKPDQTETNQEHEEHHDELPGRGPSATRPRTVRALRTEQKTAQPRRSTPPIHHRISETVEAVETRVWGHEKHQPRMLYPKNSVS
jgi:hypothetical protein